MPLKREVALKNTEIRLQDVESAFYAVGAELCKRSFFEFVKEYWDIIINEPFQNNWHIEVICKELQKVANRVFKRLPKKYDLIINVPPGSTKSTICSIMFPAWVWTRDPSLATIAVSYDHSLALTFSTKSRDIIQSDRYKYMFPDVCLKEDQNTKGLFATTAGGRRIATSTGGSVTGNHGHFLIVDDPLDPMGAKSETELLSANEYLDGTLSTRKIDKEVTPTILIMQRLAKMDPTGNMLEKGKGNVRHICIPCDDSWKDKGKSVIKPLYLRKHYRKNKGLMDPKRASRKILEEARKDLGPYQYAGQFGQSPKPMKGSTFETDKFQIVDVLPSRIVKVVRYWDKAGTKGGTGARTAGVKTARLRNGMFAVLHSKTFREEAPKRESIILQTAKSDGIGTKVYFEQEPGSGGKESAQATHRMLTGFAREADRPSGDKVFRAEPWSVEVNNGNVVLLRGAWNEEYIDEHAYFPNGDLKDQVDASAAAYAKLAGLGKKKGGSWGHGKRK